MRAFVEVDNKTEYIHDNESIVDLIEDKMGSDVADFVRGIVKEHRELSELEDRRENEALDEYEGITDSLSGAMTDVFDLTRDLEVTLKEGKRMNRNKILNVLHEINNIIGNEI